MSFQDLMTNKFQIRSMKSEASTNAQNINDPNKNIGILISEIVSDFDI